jgi:hypothetical protein
LDFPDYAEEVLESVLDEWRLSALVYELDWTTLSGTRLVENAADLAAAWSTDTVDLALLAMVLWRCLPKQHSPPHTPRPIRPRFPCAELPQFRAIVSCCPSVVANDDSITFSDSQAKL